MNETSEDLLRNINLSYLFAKTLNHGIASDFNNWKLFEPSKFIFTFFSFNMLYDIDWELTSKDNRVIYVSNATATEKIVKLLDFIYSHATNDSAFFDCYTKYDNGYIICSHLNDIRIDRRINFTDTNPLVKSNKTYLENYKDALQNLRQGKITLIDHYKLIAFTYQIRNNIFHGAKKATMMIQSGQRERLIDYTNILLATIDVFFDIMHNKFEYTLATKSELDENTGFLNR